MSYQIELLTLCGSLLGRKGRTLGVKNLEKKIEKSFIFFERIYFLENDKLMYD